MKIQFILVAFLTTPAFGSVQTFVEDPVGFSMAAGTLRTIDFETLPNGQPSTSSPISVPITATNNYDIQGVHFTAPLGILQISGNVVTGFDLRVNVSPFEKTLINADLVTPTHAAGFYFPGGSMLIAYDINGIVLGAASFNGSGSNHFLGIISDEAIARIACDRDSNGSSMQAFVFAPVPEPSSLGLLAIGLIFFSRRIVR